MSNTPIFDQMCADFFAERKVSLESLLAPKLKKAEPPVVSDVPAGPMGFRGQHPTLSILDEAYPAVTKVNLLKAPQTAEKIVVAVAKNQPAVMSLQEAYERYVPGSMPVEPQGFKQLGLTTEEAARNLKANAKKLFPSLGEWVKESDVRSSERRSKSASEIRQEMLCRWMDEGLKTPQEVENGVLAERAAALSRLYTLKKKPYQGAETQELDVSRLREMLSRE